MRSDVPEQPAALPPYQLLPLHQHTILHSAFPDAAGQNRRVGRRSWSRGGAPRAGRRSQSGAAFPDRGGSLVVQMGTLVITRWETKLRYPSLFKYSELSTQTDLSSRFPTFRSELDLWSDLPEPSAVRNSNWSQWTSAAGFH